jgi:hypothetical protein
MTSEDKKNLEKTKYLLGLARQLFQEYAMRENMEKIWDRQIIVNKLDWRLGLNLGCLFPWYACIVT